MYECLREEPAARPTAQQLMWRLGHLMEQSEEPAAATAVRSGSGTLRATAAGDGNAVGSGSAHMRVVVPPSALPSPFAAQAAVEPEAAAAGGQAPGGTQEPAAAAASPTQ